MIMNIFLWSIYLIALYFSIFFLSIFLFEPKVKLEKLEKLPKVSIIIPAWNEEKSIKETIQSALNLNYPKTKLEVVAVDHGSTDKTGKIIDSFKKQGVRILHLKRKECDNKAVALNQALKIVKGEFVACLDADSTVHPEALKKMLPYFSSKKAAIVTPLMLVKKPKTLLQKMQKYEYIVSLFIKRLASHLNCIYVAPGPFSIYKTSILKKVGLFDETAIAEDMEIVYRIQKNHYITKQCLEGGYSYVTAPKTIKELYKQRQRWYGGSLSNLYKYKNLTLSKKYKNFGMFQMPKNFFGVATVFTTLFFLTYFLVWPLIKKLYNFILVRFDLMTYIKAYSFSPSLFDIKDVNSFFIVGALLCIGGLFFVYACNCVGEKFNKKNIFPIAVFFTAYPILLCLMYLLVVFKKVTKQKLAWQKMGR